MEAHRRHHRLVAVDEYSLVVEARLQFVGLRSNPGCYQYSRNSLDSEASMEELQLEAADTDSHRSTAGVRCMAQVRYLEEIARPSRCRGKEQSRRDDDDER